MTYDKKKILQEVTLLRIKDKASTEFILKYITENTGVKIAQAYNILKEAQSHIQEIYKENRMVAFEEAIAQLEDMLMNAKAANNLKMELEIRKEISKLQGLYIERIELSGEVVVKTTWGTS